VPKRRKNKNLCITIVKGTSRERIPRGSITSNSKSLKEKYYINTTKAYVVTSMQRDVLKVSYDG